MTQKKMGRPPSGDKPMTERIFVLINDETKDKLEQCKKSLGTTTSDVVRKGIDNVFNDLEKKIKGNGALHQSYSPLPHT